MDAAGADREGGLELGDVGAADAGEGDLGLDHARPERQLQLDLVEPNVTRCVPAHGLHQAKVSIATDRTVSLAEAWFGGPLKARRLASRSRSSRE